jgi:zinc protease
MNRKLILSLLLASGLLGFAPACVQKNAGKGLTVPVTAKSASNIPARPEALKFPPLEYQPPNPTSFRTQLKSGPVVYIAPDRELPLVNLNILVRTGDYLEAAEQRGVAGLTGNLLARGGTKSMTAEALEEKLAFLAAQLGSGVGETQGNVSLNLLSKDLDEGFTILREVLTSPRFQEDKLTLLKQQLLQDMQQRNDDSADIEGREIGYLAYGEQFWANQSPVAKSIESITRADLEQFHQRWFVPGNFVIAINGDFDRDEMIERLDKLFANWPFKGETPSAIPSETAMVKPGVYLVNKDVNQGRVSILLPGIMRDDPDYFPAAIMNDILGGGGFTSRLVNRIRSDEGLAYHAGSAVPGGVYYTPPVRALFQTKSRTVPYALGLVFEEMKRIAAEPVSDEELATTINGMIDRFPRAFATKGQIVSTFAQDELTGRYAQDPDFWKNYRGRVRAVTKADVQRIAQRLLKPGEARVLVVGNEKDILLGHPDHPQRLQEFSNGNLIGWPLRDPLTLEPLSQPKPIELPPR